MQKNKHDEANHILGDCLRACICSILEISDENVPNFVEYDDHIQIIYDFFRDNDYKYCISSSDKIPEGIDYYMAWGVSPRGVQHSVVYSQGKLAHDPHPEGGGVIPDTYVWLD